MTLKTKVVVTKILKKSSAKMVKNCKVGDELVVTVPFGPVGSNRGTYATYFRVQNTRTGETNGFSSNQSATLYRALEMEEI